MVQVASPPEESVERRRQRVGQMVAEARGADLIVLPELWAPGYFASMSWSWCPAGFARYFAALAVAGGLSLMCGPVGLRPDGCVA